MCIECCVVHVSERLLSKSFAEYVIMYNISNKTGGFYVCIVDGGGVGLRHSCGGLFFGRSCCACANKRQTFSMPFIGMTDRCRSLTGLNASNEWLKWSVALVWRLVMTPPH